jgi:hypothetical protein
MVTRHENCEQPRVLGLQVSGLLMWIYRTQNSALGAAMFAPFFYTLLDPHSSVLLVLRYDATSRMAAVSTAQSRSVSQFHLVFTPIPLAAWSKA